MGVACVLIDEPKYGHAWTGHKTIWLSQRLGAYETGKYACPGGMVDDTDASDVHAIQRELLEETGIDVKDLYRFKRSIVSSHPGGKSDKTQWFVLVLSDSYWKDEIPKNLEPHKHTPWKQYSLDDAKKLPLMVSTKDVLDKLL